MDKLYVHIWEEDIVIPTYETGEPEKNPMFFEKKNLPGQQRRRISVPYY